MSISLWTSKPGPGVDPATVGTWDVEGGSTNIMGRQGWTRATLKPGDPITLVGHPMKDGSKGISLFYMIMPDGKRMYHDIARPKDDAGAVGAADVFTTRIHESCALGRSLIAPAGSDSPRRSH